MYALARAAVVDRRGCAWTRGQQLQRGQDSSARRETNNTPHSTQDACLCAAGGGCARWQRRRQAGRQAEEQASSSSSSSGSSWGQSDLGAAPPPVRDPDLQRRRERERPPPATPRCTPNHAPTEPTPQCTPHHTGLCPSPPPHPSTPHLAAAAAAAGVAVTVSRLAMFRSTHPGLAATGLPGVARGRAGGRCCDPYMHADITSNTAEPSPLPSLPPSSCAWRQAARTELTTRDLPHNPRRGPGPVVRKSSVLSPSPLLTDALSLQDRRAADRHVERKPAPKYRVPLAPQWPMEPLLSLFISACMPRLRLNSTRTTPPNRCCSSGLREPSIFALQTCSLCMKKKRRTEWRRAKVMLLTNPEPCFLCLCGTCRRPAAPLLDTSAAPS